MSAYTYKVTAKRVALKDGSFANLAVFAYKSYFWDDKMNARMAKDAACHVAERFFKGKNYTGKVVIGTLSEDGKTAVVSLVARSPRSGVFDEYEFDKFEFAGAPVVIDEDTAIARIVK